MTRREFYESFLVLLGDNYPQYEPLTRGEREVMARFMELSREQDKFRYNPFGKSAKERVGQRLDASKTNINRYVSVIRSKGYIVKDLDNIDSLVVPLRQILETNELQLMVNYKVEDDV